MIQKIIRVGNSAALTIPQKFLQETGWRIGDDLEVEGDVRTKLLLVKEKNAPYNTRITPEFKSWLDNFVKKNKALLQELARR